MEIKLNELLKEIERLNNRNPDGWTMREMVEQTGHEDKWCYKQLAKLIQKGRVRFNGKRKGTTIDGRPYYTPVYITMKGEKE